MEPIVYKPIPFFRRYGITKDGVVINLKSGEKLKPRITKNGSPQFSIIRDGENATYTTRTTKALLKLTWEK